MRYKLSVGCNFYDDPYGLQRILDNKEFYEYIHKFYLIDGVYQNRNDNPEHDHLLLENIIKQYPKIEYYNMPYHTQVQKRNKYWELARNDDFLLVLDSDEYVTIDPVKLDETLNICMNREARCFPVWQSHPQVTEMPRPRLFKKPFDYRHIQHEDRLSHSSVYDINGVEIINEMYQWYEDHEKRTYVQGIKMYHDKNYRSQERIIKDRIYYDKTSNR